MIMSSKITIFSVGKNVPDAVEASPCIFPRVYGIYIETASGIGGFQNPDNPHATKFIFFTGSYTFCVVFT